MAARDSHLNGIGNGSRRSLLVPAVVLLLVICAATLLTMRKGTAAIRADHAERGPLVATISTNGKVEPIVDFQAHSPISTTVQKIYVNPGDHVKKGQLLLTLDDATVRAQSARAYAQLKASEAEQANLQAGGSREEVLTRQSQLAKAQADRDAAAKNLDAMKRLQQSGAAAPAEVQAAENQLKVADAALQSLQQQGPARYNPQDLSRVQATENEAKASYEAAQATLADTNVRAGVDGVVYTLPFRDGSFVNPGDLLVGVAELKTVQVRTFIDEPDIGRLSQGEQVTVTWDALPDRSWTGTVTRVPTTIVTRNTRMVGEIVVDVPNDDLKLLPNTNVSVSIVTAERKNVLSVPRESVRQDGDQKYVFVVSDNKIHRQNVQTGISNLTRVEVSGLGDRATVALNSLNMQPLRDGMKVKVEGP
ncbi:MAG TPA: efflux RND transporter periplasmic adaptor subunit [Candidatus Koribacter sp.]|jgi:HlyD family secretion protein